MAWQTPKTDWKAGDVPAASDFNRIEGNTQEVKDEIGSVSGGLDAHLSDYMPHKGFDFDTTMTYDDKGNLIQVDEKEGATLKTRTTLDYDENGNLETVNVKKYAPNGIDVDLEFTDTLTYDIDGNLEKVERTVV
jgi:YD repeat-containing protein